MIPIYVLCFHCTLFRSYYVGNTNADLHAYDASFNYHTKINSEIFIISAHVSHHYHCHFSSHSICHYQMGASHCAELHAMLFGTIMIRRLKKDMLTELPRKTRHIVRVEVLDKEQKDELR